MLRNLAGEEYQKGAVPEPKAWEFQQILKLLKPKENENLLDIGCDTGEFCYLLKEKYHSCPRGIDINVQSIEVAKARYPDIIFENKALNDLEGEEKYDAITMIEVFEHLSDPREALLKVRECLKPGGRLVLSTPNKWSFIRFKWWIQGKRFLYDPTHLHTFNPYSLAHLFHEAGFDIEKITTKILGVPLVGRISKNLAEKLPSLLFGGWLFGAARRN